jgi:AcrR family transcriptional regulator
MDISLVIEHPVPKQGMDSWARMSRNDTRSDNDRRRRPKAEDRRIGRTKDALHGAMISLVLEKGYEAVTIKDIVDRANVGRSTFYAHYTSKEDLLTAEMADLRRLLTARQRSALAGEGGIGERCLGFSRALFEHAASYRDIYRALVGSLMSILAWWTDRKSGLPPAALDALFRRMVVPGIEAALGRTA